MDSRPAMAIFELLDYIVNEVRKNCIVYNFSSLCYFMHFFFPFCTAAQYHLLLLFLSIPPFSTAPT